MQFWEQAIVNVQGYVHRTASTMIVSLCADKGWTYEVVQNLGLEQNYDKKVAIPHPADLQRGFVAVGAIELHRELNALNPPGFLQAPGVHRREPCGIRWAFPK